MSRGTDRSRRKAATGAIVTLCATLLLAQRPASAYQNWADRLGYGANFKVLILHADDAGMFPGSNTAIQQMLQLGEIQSASIMAPLPYHSDMVTWHNNQGPHDIGLHLTLNAEWDKYKWGPVFDPPRDVRRILKKRFLFWGWRPWFPGGSLWTFFYRGPITMQRELGAQVDLAIHGRPANGGLPAIPAMVPPPSHLDSHMGSVFIRKSYFKKYLELAVQKGIPALTFENFDFTEACFVQRGPDDPTRRIVGWLSKRLKRAQDATSWPFPRLDQYCPIPYGADLSATRTKLHDLIVNELPNGITQILFHPADEDPLLRSSTSHSRAERLIKIDRKLFDSTDNTNILLPANLPGVKYTTWRHMVQRFNNPDPCAPIVGDPVPFVQPSTCP